MPTKSYIWYIGTLICFLFSCKLSPSAKLKDYESYFAKETNLEQQGLRVTYFGTSTLLFDDGESQVLIDGFFSRPGVLKTAFGKVKSNEKIIQECIERHDIHRLKAIFVCHSHYDHVLDAPSVCKLTGAILYGSTSTLEVGKGAALPSSQMQLFEPGKEIRLGQFWVTVLESKHTPPFRILGKSNATDPEHPTITAPISQPAKADAFIEGGTFDIYIRHGNKRMLVKASTNYIEGALNAYPCNIIFLGTAMLGTFQPEFAEKYYQETVIATGARRVIPIHWDNFMRPLSKPFHALPKLSDNVKQGFDFLIQKAKQDRIDFEWMGNQQTIKL